MPTKLFDTRRAFLSHIQFTAFAALSASTGGIMDVIPRIRMALWTLRFEAVAKSTLLMVGCHFFNLLSFFGLLIGYSARMRGGQLTQCFPCVVPTLLATSVSFACISRVFGRKFMSLLTMSFNGVTRWHTRATQYVCSMCRSFQMRWIHTTSIATKMVTFQRRWYRLNKPHICQPMRKCSQAVFFGSMKNAISRRYFTCNPFPARIILVERNSGKLKFTEKALQYVPIYL